VKVDLPRIAIIGRPNVGKSTLFNRLLGRRKAITDPTPGVTRDAIESEVKIGKRKYILVDTGGVTTDTNGYNPAVSSKAIATAESADLILLVLDVHDVQGADRDFIEKLRRFSEKIVLVVNKVDTADKEQLVWNLFELGFERVVNVSAEHGRNIPRLKEEIENHFGRGTSVEPEPAIDTEVIRIAILGKPNTGKSTLANVFLGEERSLVSDMPGTTRDTVEGRFSHDGEMFYVIDTAGIRKKAKVKESVEYYSVNRAIDSILHCDVAILLIDSIDDISEQDKKIAAQIEKHGKGIILALSKWDRLKEVPNRLNAVTDRIRFLFPVLSFAPILPISSHTGFGLEKLLVTAKIIHKELRKRIDTPRLNKALESWVEQYSVKVKGRPVKLHYMTQVSSNPLRFVCFQSRDKGLRGEYENYLKNRIRSDFGLEHVPISVEFRINDKK
jgi:GTP-binding protein